MTVGRAKSVDNAEEDSTGHEHRDTESVGLGTPGPNLALAFPCLSGGLTTHSINILPGPAPAGAAAIVTFAHRGAILCGDLLKLGSSSFDIGV